MAKIALFLRNGASFHVFSESFKNQNWGLARDIPRLGLAAAALTGSAAMPHIGASCIIPNQELDKKRMHDLFSESFKYHLHSPTIGVVLPMICVCCAFYAPFTKKRRISPPLVTIIFPEPAFVSAGSIDPFLLGWANARFLQTRTIPSSALPARQTIRLPAPAGCCDRAAQP